MGADKIIHLAASPSVPASIRDPLLANEHTLLSSLVVFEVARELGIKRVVYASSSAVYGDSSISPKTESLEKQFLSFYALQKSTVEEYVHFYNSIFNSEFIGLRFFNVFGPHQDANSEYSAVIPKFINIIKSGSKPTIYGDGETSRDFIFVKDVVRGILLACDYVGEMDSDVFNLACGVSITLNDLVRYIAENLNKSITPIYENFKIGDIKSSLADISKSSEILGFKPLFSFSDGLKETIYYYSN